MDTDSLQQEINKARALLPQESLEAIDAIDWRTTIRNMGNRYNPEQLDVLETETELMLCGLLLPEDFHKEIQGRMNISQTEADSLVSDLDRLIFQQMKHVLEQRIIEEPPAPQIKTPTYTQNSTINPMFTNLPKEVQDAIASSNYQKELYLIANEEKLSIEQMGKLESTTNKIILGTASPDNYEKTLEAELGLAPDKALELSNKVNTRVLMSIRSAMKGEVAPKPPSTPVAPVSKEPEVPEPTIPKPPYQETRKPVTPLVPKQPIPQSATGDDQILNNSGIEVMADNSIPKNLPTTEEAIKEEEAMLGQDGVSIVEPDIKVPAPAIESTPTMEQETLAGVENPSKSPTHIISGEIPERKANVVRDKFSQPVMNLQGASDQSNPSATSNLHKDPYREPIE